MNEDNTEVLAIHWILGLVPLKVCIRISGHQWRANILEADGGRVLTYVHSTTHPNGGQIGEMWWAAHRQNHIPSREIVRLLSQRLVEVQYDWVGMSNEIPALFEGQRGTTIKTLYFARNGLRRDWVITQLRRLTRNFRDTNDARFN